MATLADLKRYMETGRHGRPCPLSEIKELSEAERAELVAALGELTDEERKA